MRNIVFSNFLLSYLSIDSFDLVVERETTAIQTTQRYVLKRNSVSKNVINFEEGEC